MASQLSDLSAELVVGDIVTIGIGNDHEAWRHGEAGASQLAEVCTLPARLIDVVPAQLVKLLDEDHRHFTNLAPGKDVVSRDPRTASWSPSL